VQPLQITAHLIGAFSSHHPIALDSLIADRWAKAHDYPPAALEERIPPHAEMPLLLHPLGMHHASEAHLIIQGHETIHWARKSWDVRMLALFGKSARVKADGRYKAYYMPLRRTIPAGMLLTWWCVGDAAEIAWLLSTVAYLGHKRSSGHGRVGTWSVEPWPEDWSLLRPGDDGALIPTRPLPPELAPAGWMSLRTCRRTYPYYRQDGAELLAVPPAPEILAEEW
jgi:hypothetical protein